MKTLTLTTMLCLGLCSPTFALQAPASPSTITNADVMTMLASGVPEGTILAAIQYGRTSFDTSPTAIIGLKDHEVPPSVIEAMVRKTGGGQAAGTDQGSGASGQNARGSGTEAAAGPEPPGEGVYYKGPGGWVKLETMTMSGGGLKKVGKMLVPGLTPHFVWTFRGATAPVRVLERRPVFYIKQTQLLIDIPGQSARDVVIVKFDQKEDHRELQTTSGSSAFTFKAGFSKERTPDIVVTQISPGLLSVTPAQDLADGEYFLTFGSGGYTGYDFGMLPLSRKQTRKLFVSCHH